jgi:hypothetical protein
MPPEVREKFLAEFEQREQQPPHQEAQATALSA